MYRESDRITESRRKSKDVGLGTIVAVFVGGIVENVERKSGEKNDI